MGKRLHVYMVNYISSHKKRKSKIGSSLAKNIEFYDMSGPAKIAWGIGKISKLQSTNPYWYVLNYGKKVSGERFIPGGGRFRPVQYSDGKPQASLKGHGGAVATTIGQGKPVSPIRPIPYIDVTQFKMGQDLRKLLAVLRST